MSPTRFRHISLVVCAAWFVFIYPLLNFFAWEILPETARSNSGDFGQYYSGAIALQEGLADTLYPDPDPEIYDRPPDFRPRLTTPLFDQKQDDDRAGNWAYYPQVASPSASKVSDRLVKKAPQIQGEYRFIYPPPLVILLAPLGLFEYDFALRAVWFPLMCFSLFGISWFSAKICRALYGRESYVEGVSILLPMIPTLLASELGTSLCVGNVTPLLGLFITLVAYAFLSNRQIALGLGIIPLILFKGMGVLWCPLLLIGKIKWKALFLMAFLTILLNGLTIYLGGTGLYRVFFSEMLPKASLPLGIGAPGIMMDFLGVEFGSLWLILRGILALGVYFYCWKALRNGHGQGLVSLNGLIALIASFNLLNNIVWPHYVTCYLVLPFSAWIIREVSLLQGRSRLLLVSVLLSFVICWFDAVAVTKGSMLVGFLEQARLYSSSIDTVRKVISGLSFYVISNAVNCTFLFLAIQRLRLLGCRVSVDAVSITPKRDLPVSA